MAQNQWNKYIGILVKKGDIIDCSIHDVVEMKKKGVKNMKLTLRSLNKKTYMTIFAPEYSIGMKNARITEISGVNFYPYKTGTGWKLFCTLNVELEDAGAEEPTHIAEVSFIDRTIDAAKDIPKFDAKGSD